MSNSLLTMPVASEHCFLRTSFFPWPIKTCHPTCFGPARVPIYSCFPLVCSTPPCNTLLFSRDSPSVLQLVQAWPRAAIHLASCSSFGFQRLTENNGKISDAYFDFILFSPVDLVGIFQFAIWGEGGIWKNEYIFKHFFIVFLGG